jgi:hypothetical protein
MFMLGFDLIVLLATSLCLLLVFWILVLLVEPWEIPSQPCYCNLFF